MRELVAATILVIIVLVAWPAMASDTATTLVDRGRVALEQGDIDPAIDFLDQAIDSKQLQGKNLAEAYYLRGKAYESKSYWGQAGRNYAYAVWLDKSDETYRKAHHRMLRKTKASPR